MPKAVKIFNDLSAEVGDPSISLFVAKLPNPTLSFGILNKVITIKKILIRNENNLIILLKVVNCHFIVISNNSVSLNRLIFNFKNFFKNF